RSRSSRSIAEIFVGMELYGNSLSRRGLDDERCGNCTADSRRRFDTQVIPALIAGPFVIDPGRPGAVSIVFSIVTPASEGDFTVTRKPFPAVSASPVLVIGVSDCKYHSIGRGASSAIVSEPDARRKTFCAMSI